MSVILVTGGNRGIGLGIVQALATRIPTATILIGCRSAIAGRETIEKLKGLGIQSSLDTVQIDIENDASITAAVEAVDAKYGKLDG